MWGLTRERGGGQREVAMRRGVKQGGPWGDHQAGTEEPQPLHLSDGPPLAYLIAVTCQCQQSFHWRLQPR